MREKPISGATKLAWEIKRDEIGKIYRIATEDEELLGLCREPHDLRWVLGEALACHENFKRTAVAEGCERYIYSLSERDIEELRQTRISSLLALGVHSIWVAELVGSSPPIIRTNYKRPLPETVAQSGSPLHL